MKPIILDAQAEEELIAAVTWYEEQRPGLGDEFLEDIEAAKQRIREHPLAFPTEDDQGSRYFIMKRFPYTLVYVELDATIWVAAVAHHSRRSRYWARRYPD